MLMEARLCIGYWNFAYMYSIIIHNMYPVYGIDEPSKYFTGEKMSPYEKLYDARPPREKLRIFGSRCLALPAIELR